MRTLLWDIRQQRPEVSIREGEFYSGVDDYSIRVNKKNPQTNVLYDIKIYDHTAKRGNTSVIIADSGTMKITVDKKKLLLTLWNGYNYSEEEEDRRKRERTYPHRLDTFREQIINIELTGFGLQRSDENLFKNNYQMMSLRQLDKEIDSLNTDLSQNEHKFKSEFIAANYFLMRKQREDVTADYINEVTSDILDVDSLVESVEPHLQDQIIVKALDQARSAKVYVESSHGNLHYKRRQLRRHEIEWHKKFTLSIGCLIFLLVGAPLGAIIRKGGLGMPTVISVVLFIFWYVISLTGEKVVRESIVPSYQGIWLPSIVFLMVGTFLLYKASTDSALFNIDVYLVFIRKLLGIEKETMLSKNLHLVGKFQYTEIEHDELISSLNSLSSDSGKLLGKLKDDLKFPKSVNKFIHAGNNDELQKLSNNYTVVFDALMTSKWARISYIKNRLSEYPYLKNTLMHKSSKFLRILWVLIFPVFIIELIQLVRIRKKVKRIIEVTNSIVNALNNQAMLSELEEAS